jgi:DNA modification methylase
VTLILGSCERALDEINPGTVDLILTDPPYIKETLDEALRLLSLLGNKLLKPSGFLVTYAGQYHLPAFINTLGTEELSYFWQAVTLNNGDKPYIFSRGLMAAYKPILIYQKKPIKKGNWFIHDVLDFAMEKQYHPWQQSIREAIVLLKAFSHEGDLVLDPFMGSGTIPLAAKLLGRQAIGYEIDEKTFRKAERRMEQRAIIQEFS